MRVYISGCEGPGSGSFDWNFDKDKSEQNYQRDIEALGKFPDEIIYSGELDAPEGLEGEGMTDYLENYLMENDFESAPLENKRIYER